MIAKGHNFRQSGLRQYAATMSTAKEIAMKITASLTFMLPDGISLLRVLGFPASIFRSTTLFIPIAPDRAPTIAIAIHTICLTGGMPDAARSAAVNAKGRAKTEWAILIIFR